MTPFIAAVLLASGPFPPQSPPAEPYDPSPPALPEEALAILDSAPYVHDAPVVSAAVPGDGRYLLSLDSEGTVYGWECRGATRLYRRQVLDRGHSNRRLACSPDGRWVSVASRDSRTVHILDLISGDDVGRIDRCAGHAFSHDGRIIAGWSGPRIRLWELATGRELPPFPDADSAILEGAFTPDARIFAATVSGSHGPVLWNTRTRLRVFGLKPEGEQPRATGLAVAPDGETLAVGDPRGVTFWTLAGNHALFSRRQEAMGGPPLRFTSDGRQLIGTARPKRIELWDLRTGEAIDSWFYPSTVQGFIEISDAGDQLIRAVGRGIRLEKIAPSAGNEAPPRKEEESSLLGFLEDGRALTQGPGDRIRFWIAGEGRLLRSASLPASTHTRLSRSGRIAGFLPQDFSLRVWDAESGGECMRARTSPYLTTLDLSPDGRELLGATADGHVSCWEIAEKRERFRFRTQGVGVSAICWGPDGKSLAWGEDSGAVVFADARRGSEFLRYRPRGARINALAFAPDGRSVVTGDASGTARRWEDEIGREPLLVGTRGASVFRVAFSRDGRWIAGGDSEGIVTLWPTEGDREPVTFTGPRREVRSLAFSPDGALLISAGAAGAAVVWKVPHRP